MHQTPLQGTDTLGDRDATALVPESFSAEVLSQAFNLYYQPVHADSPEAAALRRRKVHRGVAGCIRRTFGWVRTEGSLFRSLLVLHTPDLCRHGLLMLMFCATVSRGSTPPGLLQDPKCLTPRCHVSSTHHHLVGITCLAEVQYDVHIMYCTVLYCTCPVS